MMIRTCALALLAAAAPVHSAEFLVMPFEITYAVLDNGREIGEAKVALKEGENGRFIYTSNSTGTAGLAALLGGKIDERTELEWTGSELRPISFTYAQNFALRTRTQDGSFDWVAKRASGQNKNKPWSRELPAHTINRQMVDLVVAQATASGASEIKFDVLDRGDVRSWRFKRDGEENLETRAGTFPAVRVLRVRESADGRETRMWFAPSLGHIPIRVEHTEKDGRGLALDLKIKPKG